MPKTDITETELNAIIHKNRSSLRNFIRFLGVHGNDIDDIAQETYLIAIKKIDECDDLNGFDKWTRGIARNIVLNHHRSLRIKSSKLQVLFSDDMIMEVEQQYALKDKSIYINRMLECMKRLPEKNQELLRKRYMHNINSKKLSEYYDQSPSSVRKTLMKSRFLIMECIETKLGEVAL